MLWLATKYTPYYNDVKATSFAALSKCGLLQITIALLYSESALSSEGEASSLGATTSLDASFASFAFS